MKRGNGQRQKTDAEFVTDRNCARSFDHDPISASCAMLFATEHLIAAALGQQAASILAASSTVKNPVMCPCKRDCPTSAGGTFASLMHSKADVDQREGRISAGWTRIGGCLGAPAALKRTSSRGRMPILIYECTALASLGARGCARLNLARQRSSDPRMPPPPPAGARAGRTCPPDSRSASARRWRRPRAGRAPP